MGEVYFLSVQHRMQHIKIIHRSHLFFGVIVVTGLPGDKLIEEGNEVGHLSLEDSFALFSCGKGAVAVGAAGRAHTVGEIDLALCSGEDGRIFFCGLVHVHKIGPKVKHA